MCWWMYKNWWRRGWNSNVYVETCRRAQKRRLMQKLFHFTSLHIHKFFSCSRFSKNLFFFLFQFSHSTCMSNQWMERRKIMIIIWYECQVRRNKCFTMAQRRRIKIAINCFSFSLVKIGKRVKKKNLLHLFDRKRKQ